MTRHSPQAMRCLVLAALVAAWTLGSSAPVRGQNPITAAKEAFRKAREDAKRPAQPAAPAQPVEPGQPAQAAQRPAAATGPSMADCCSPEALSKLAASVGFIDIVGVKLGMTLEQAVAAIKAANPKLIIDVHDLIVEAGAKQGRRPHVILAHMPPLDPNRPGEGWYNRDGSQEAIGVQVTPPPGPMVVELVVRYVKFANSAPVAASNIVDALQQKYGRPAWAEHSQSLGWIFDNTGKPGPVPPTPQQACRPGQLRLSGGDLRGNSATAPGRVFETLNQYSNSSIRTDDFAAKCAAYVVARADIDHANPSTPVSDFWMTIQSSGLAHYSMVLTSAYIQAEIESQIKQRDDAAGKRAVPKL